jgi:hypothetical protein
VTRLVVVGLPGCAVWAALLVAIALAEDDAMSSWAVPAREIVTIGAVAFGLAGLAHRRDERSAALAGAFGSVLAMGLISAFAFRYRWLPSLGMIEHHERWWFAAGIGIVTAALSSRDAAASLRRPRFLDRSGAR